MKVAPEKLERNLLEKAARDFMVMKQQKEESELLNTKAHRQQHYDKSYKSQ